MASHNYLLFFEGTYNNGTSKEFSNVQCKVYLRENCLEVTSNDITKRLGRLTHNIQSIQQVELSISGSVRKGLLGRESIIELIIRQEDGNTCREYVRVSENLSNQILNEFKSLISKLKPNDVIQEINSPVQNVQNIENVINTNVRADENNFGARHPILAIFAFLFVVGTLWSIGQALFSPGHGNDNESDAYVFQQYYVKALLKSPATANFESQFDTSYKDLGHGEYIFTSYVDSQNGFGAIVRTNYTIDVAYNYDSQQWEVKNFDPSQQ